jgi:hypothetical protein
MADQPRKFRQLSSETIRDIIAQHQLGTNDLEIASTFQVDKATVRYHIERFESTYGRTNVYEVIVIRQPKPCQHPSLKCLLCGTAQDHIRRRELEIIKDLTSRLTKAEDILRRHDLLVE